MFKKISTLFLDAIFPLECIHCKTEGTLLCAACNSLIQIKLQTFDNPSENISRIYIATDYHNELLQKIVHQFKYAGVAQFAPVLASIIRQSIDASLLENSALMPIPLHRKRYLKRGYNQSELIANQLATYWNLKLDTNLHRSKNNPSQTKLTREERFTNVENIFHYKHKEAPPKVLLVDDIATTFATLESAATELKRCGAQKVVAIVIAKNAS